MTKHALALVSLVFGLAFFVIVYDFFLWDKVVFPQILTEPSVGRDLFIRKQLSEHRFPEKSTFIFGSSKALNGIDCNVLDQDKALIGECFNLGIPGSPLSFEEYLWDVLKLKPKNIVFVQDYLGMRDLFDEQSAARCADIKIPISPKHTADSLHQPGFWNYKAFLKRWSYKNRLIHAMVGIDETKGYGRVGDNLKNPILIFWLTQGLQNKAFEKEEDGLKFYYLARSDHSDSCSSYMAYFFNLSNFVHEHLPDTNVFIIIYPSHPAGLKILDLPERYLRRDAFLSLQKTHPIRILNFINFLPGENQYWADASHISSESVDKISRALLEEMRRYN